MRIIKPLIGASILGIGLLGAASVSHAQLGTPKNQAAVIDKTATADAKQAHLTTADMIVAAAKSGRITEDGKAKLLAKLSEIKAQDAALRTSMAGQMHEQKLATIDQKQAELEQWESANHLPTDILHVMSPFNN